MGPPKCGAPGNCPVCPPLKPALYIYIYIYIYHYKLTYNGNVIIK